MVDYRAFAGPRRGGEDQYSVAHLIYEYFRVSAKVSFFAESSESSVKM